MRAIILPIFIASLLVLNPIPSYPQAWNVDLMGSISSTWWQGNAVAVQGDFAYMTYQTAPYEAHLGVIDITDPQAPLMLGSCDFNSAPFDLVVQGHYAYVADDGEGLKVIDISNPQSPQLVGSYYTQGLVYCVDISGNYAYAGYNNMFWSGGLYVFDVSDPTNPLLISDCSTPDRCEGMDVYGNHAYMAAWNAGLRIIDISNPYYPFEVGSCNPPNSAYGVTVSGDYAYVADLYNGFRVIDVSEPSNPYEVGYCDTPGEAHRIALSGICAFVSDWDAGIRVINIFDPSNPFEVGYYDTPGNELAGIATIENLAYSADETLFGVFDGSDAMNYVTVMVLADPVNPPISIPETGGSFDFNITYENISSQAQTFDTWTVIHLPNVGEVEVLNVRDITLSQGLAVTRQFTQEVPETAPAGIYTYYCYVGEYPWIVNHYDSFTFEKAGNEQIGTLGLPSGWLCYGDVFGLDLSDVETAMPGNFQLHSAYPNPFNPTATIAFSLPNAGKINLIVYDVSGHLVTELIDGWREAGVQEVTFDGSGFGSGVYFYSIQAGAFNAVKKMVLVK